MKTLFAGAFALCLCLTTSAQDAADDVKDAPPPERKENAELKLELEQLRKRSQEIRIEIGKGEVELDRLRAALARQTDKASKVQRLAARDQHQYFLRAVEQAVKARSGQNLRAVELLNTVSQKMGQNFAYTNLLRDNLKNELEKAAVALAEEKAKSGKDGSHVTDLKTKLETLNASLKDLSERQNETDDRKQLIAMQKEGAQLRDSIAQAQAELFEGQKDIARSQSRTEALSAQYRALQESLNRQTWNQLVQQDKEAAARKQRETEVEVIRAEIEALKEAEDRLAAGDGKKLKQAIDQLAERRAQIETQLQLVQAFEEDRAAAALQEKRTQEMLEMKKRLAMAQESAVESAYLSATQAMRNPKSSKTVDVRLDSLEEKVDRILAVLDKLLDEDEGNDDLRDDK